MSDPSTPVLPPTDPAPSTPSPGRPWTILGRLSKAVREQNWFAVVLELAIVVLGVVIGFQVTSWGQDRSERVREQTYLRQLVDELLETEQLILSADSTVGAKQFPSLDRLLQTWGADARPPRDSVLLWLFDITKVEMLRPVLGTAEGLIATGDLSLVRNDSLRTAITMYVEEARRLMEWQSKHVVQVGLGWRQIGERVDFLERRQPIPDSVRDVLLQRELIPAFIPSTDWTTPFPLDVDALYSDPVAYNAVYSTAVSQREMGLDRAILREGTTALREQVETELTR